MLLDLDLRGSIAWEVSAPGRLPLADERHHAAGHAERGGVGRGEALQAEDHVAAPLEDDLPHVLFVGIKTEAKSSVRHLLHRGDVPKASPCFPLPGQMSESPSPCVCRSPTPRLGTRGGSGTMSPPCKVILNTFPGRSEVLERAESPLAQKPDRVCVTLQPRPAPLLCPGHLPLGLLFLHPLTPKPTLPALRLRDMFLSQPHVRLFKVSDFRRSDQLPKGTDGAMFS